MDSEVVRDFLKIDKLQHIRNVIPIKKELFMSLPRDYLTNEIIEQLYIFSKRKVSKYKIQPICFTLTGEDVAHEAIQKTLSGIRPWNQKKCPHLLIHLMGCAKSIISNHTTSKETRTIKRESDLDYGKKNEIPFTLDALQMNIDHLNEQALSSHGNREDTLYALKKTMNYISENHENLIDFAYEVLIQGRTKPKELALYFGITVREVNVKKTALKRILIKLQEGEK